jgi:nucleotide-binding universal stress UspA family protein
VVEQHRPPRREDLPVTIPTPAPAAAAAPPTVRRVVVAFDGSPQAVLALDEGVQTARSLRVPLLLVTAVEPMEYSEQARTELEALGRDRLDEGERLARRGTDARWSEVMIERYLGTGSARDVILGLARPDDLLVVGSRGHSPAGRLLLGSTSTAVASHAPCPVLVVPAPGRPDGPVVVGLDSSAASLRVLGAARDAAARLGTTLSVVGAVPPLPTPVAEAPAVRVHEVVRLREAREELASLVGSAALEALPSLEVRVEAEEAADLLVRHGAGAACSWSAPVGRARSGACCWGRSAAPSSTTPAAPCSSSGRSRPGASASSRPTCWCRPPDGRDQGLGRPFSLVTWP